jgi:hypothetical protein
MIAPMRIALAALLVSCLWQTPVLAQCAPAPDSPYFFRNLSEQRAEAKIAEDRGFYEDLLTDSFASRGADGKPNSKQDFIAAELAPSRPAASRRFYSISDYTLVEHVQGHTVASYLLREVTTTEGQARVQELRLRETYEVQDGRWRLAAVEFSPVASALPEARASR